MSRVPFSLRPVHATLILAGLLTACGGGNGDSPGASDGGRGGGLGQTTPVVDVGHVPGGPDNGGPGRVVPGDGETGSTPGTGNPGTGTPGTGTPGTGTPGGGDHGDEGTTPPQSGASTVMACADSAPAGSVVQCSGDRLLRSDHGVGATRSGVQVWAKSTRDEAVVAHGLAPAGFDAGMTAELRITRNPATGAATRPALLLDRLDLSWDGRSERPKIIDTFHGGGESRVELDHDGRISRIALPASSDLAFYDHGVRGTAGTQAHYANNVYFPRSPDNPARCPPYLDPTSLQCRSESLGIQGGPAGDWRQGGTGPDRASAVRFHEDGDVHAGNAATGNPPILPGGSGLGAPFPGSKGYRALDHLGYRYANLAAWFTQDTVGIVEWTGGPGLNEHNKVRRGMVAFGEVTDPAAVPVAGTVTYAGVAEAWRSIDGDADPVHLSSPATVTVDLATREARVTLPSLRPGGLSFTVRGDDTAAPWRNFLTGAVGTAGSLSGGASTRYFGPVGGGSGGQGPLEFGGTFSLRDPVSGEALIGGFVAMKR